MLPSAAPPGAGRGRGGRGGGDRGGGERGHGRGGGRGGFRGGGGGQGRGFYRGGYRGRGSALPAGPPLTVDQADPTPALPAPFVEPIGVLRCGITATVVNLIDLALEFLGKRGQYDALVPGNLFPERERIRLQHFLSGIRILNPYSPTHPEKHRRIWKLTRLGARDDSFEIEEGQTMTVAEFLRTQCDITLKYPDVISVEVCARSTLSAYVGSASVSSRLGRSFR